MEQSRDRRFTLMFCFIVLSAVAARLCVGVLYFNSFDTYWYRDWAFGLQDGLFDIYSRAESINLDYPPLYLFCLSLTGLAYKVFGADCSAGMQMFLMKFWPIFFDALCIILIYKICRRYGEWTALFAAAAWAANPAVFYNTAFWGQTDQLMALLLLAAFYLAESNRPVLSCVVFAAAGLTKYQSLFFTPVLLPCIYKRCGAKRMLAGVGAAAGTVAAVFLPFMIGAHQPWLFFKVYLSGVGTYRYCTFNAYNIYALFGLNAVIDSTALFGGVTFAHINFVVTALIIAFTVFLLLRSQKPSAWVGGLLIMTLLFMFMTRMHERYQYIVLPFALMSYVTTRRRCFLWQGIMLTVTGFINQVAVLENVNGHWNAFLPYQSQIVVLVSLFNLFICIYVAYTCAIFLLERKDAENELQPQEV